MPKPVTKPWSLLAFIAGDNNLSDDGLRDVTEMCESGARPAVHAAVQIDTIGEHDGSVRYEITEPDFEGKCHRTVIERLPESDTGDPAILRDFLAWGSRRYPAEKQLAVIWGHGNGFRTRLRRDLALDDHGTSLDMPRLATALSRAGYGDDKRLAILGLDACLMCMLEVCHHVAPYTDRVVGSQQSEPSDGWPYHRVLKTMHGDPSPDVLAKAIVRVYLECNKRAGEENVTQSAIRTKGLDAAMEALSALGRLLVKTAAKSDLRTLRLQIQAFEMADYVDALHLVRLLGRKPFHAEVQAAAKAFGASLKACILANGVYGDSVKEAGGLSMWFPPDETTYQANRATYLRMRLGRRKALTGWVDFLDWYFG